MRSSRVLFSSLSVAVLVSIPLTIAVAQNRAASKRAKLPTFTPAQANRVYFPDVFAKVEGERPANPNANANVAAAGSSTPGTAASAGGAGGGFAWTKIISPTTLEDEIKALKLAADKNITTPTDFAGRGYKEIRRDFTLLAVLFAVINEYDTDVRFKKDAAVARDLLGRTASNAKAGGNANVFNESKKRRDELADLLNGSALEAQAEQVETNWEQTASRTPLMQRLEISGEKNLAAWTSNDAEFGANIEKVLHDAEIVATIAEVLTREGLEDAGDEEYTAFAKRMQAGALNTVAAVKSNNGEQARAAVGEITKACADCHASYR